MISTSYEIFDEINEIHQSDKLGLIDKYARLRTLLERICKDLTADDKVSFPSLFSRLNYVCHKLDLSREQIYKINGFRVRANKVLHSGLKVTEEDYAKDFRAFCETISIVCCLRIPEELSNSFVDVTPPSERSQLAPNYKCLRIVIQSVDADFIYFTSGEENDVKKLSSKHDKNHPFYYTLNELWVGAELNLIDVIVDENEVYCPKFIVLEPDYLIDISSLAECFKEYGNSPLNYIQSRLEPMKNTKHILLGNAANTFLDELLNQKTGTALSSLQLLKDIVFKSSPFEFSACSDIEHPVDFKEFLNNAETQFANIKNVIENVFPLEAHKIECDSSILEPSFLCEQLGVQGRLDLLQLSSHAISKIVELKSGKAPFPDNNHDLVGRNHSVQAYLYFLIIQYVLNIHYDTIRTYIFYSKYSTGALRNPTAVLKELQKIIDLRNRIILNEHKIVNDESDTVLQSYINRFTVQELVTEQINQKFMEQYIAPQIFRFQQIFKDASDLEMEYFRSFYTFVAKELYLSKVGEADYDSNRGLSSLWQSSLQQKLESGDILIDLQILENGCDKMQPIIKFKIPNLKTEFNPNFRIGDVVLFYERNLETDSVKNKQVFKGNINNIKKNSVEVSLRSRQRNTSCIPQTSKYAIEKDFMDSSFNSMFKGLFSFLHANKDRKDLLLNIRQPEQNQENYLVNIYDQAEIQQIVYKAKIAKDYFLLVGPPGTGKTSVAFKAMVIEYLSDPDINLLLLAYTNRAVDEMCAALDTIESKPRYIRIGSELACDDRYKCRLLQKVIANCDSRTDVKQEIRNHRIYIGTIASVSNKLDLFNLKTFDVAIVDEASQILEPHIVGILCAKNKYGSNAVGKFILIGDNKQLPAVVVQNRKDSIVTNENLLRIGLQDRRNSLFERLYHTHRKTKSNVWDMLYKQGRMHPDISLFPNHAFYKSELRVVPLPHQKEGLSFLQIDQNNYFQRLLSKRRLCFIPSTKCKEDISPKVNSNEAKIVSKLVENIYRLYKLNNRDFKCDKTIGVITPYRSQIGVIKRRIELLGIEDLNNISVDTVERFQGSERDFIIYSICLNNTSQLRNLVSNIEEDGVLIDRKLNVVLTRARKQLYIIGNSEILSNDLTHFRLMEFIRSKGGLLNCTTEEFLNADFEISDPETDVDISGPTFEPDREFSNVFNQVVIEPLKNHKDTVWPESILGKDHDYIRLNVLQYGRANFDQSTFEISCEEKVNLYCYYNMRKHYFTTYAIFKSFHDYFLDTLKNTTFRNYFIDVGCGPMTSGLAFNQLFKLNANYQLNYVGVDTSNAMLGKAREFSRTELFSNLSSFNFINSLSNISIDTLKEQFALPNTVFLNFSYLFGNLDIETSEKLAKYINDLVNAYPLNRYIIIFQNSSLEKRNRSYYHFKKIINKFNSVTEPKTETVSYRNSEQSSYDKSEIVYYEILAT